MNHQTVEAKPFNKDIFVPTSKSYANRILVLAAISKKPVTLIDLPEANDVKNMLRCFKEIGLEIEVNENKTTIKNSFPECEDSSSNEPITLEAGDGGTTNRFLFALLSKGKKTYHLNAKGGMRERPMDDLSKPLKKLDVKIERGNGSDPYWYSITGPMTLNDGQTIEVDCSKSTQFITGIALALADSIVKVIPQGMDSSRKYYELTLDLIEQFKQEPSEFTIPIDFSSISYPLALGLLSERVFVTNCKERDYFQADSVFLPIIEEMGGVLNWRDGGLEIKSIETLKPIDRDCSGFPDLVPTLAFVCSYAQGSSYLRNLGVLKHKESDRIAETLRILDCFEVAYHYDEGTETIEIKGPAPKVNFKEFDPPEDHRMIMVAYIFMRVNSGGRVSNSEHTDKSFPEFFAKMNT